MLSVHEFLLISVTQILFGGLVLFIIRPTFVYKTMFITLERVPHFDVRSSVFIFMVVLFNSVDPKQPKKQIFI